jgi:hypothetical protein
MLDPAALAPVQKIAQPLGVRFDGLGVFEEGVFTQELLYLIRHPLTIGIAILLDCYTTAHSVKRSLPALLASAAALKSCPTDSYFTLYRR